MSAISSDQIGKKGLKVKIIAILVFVLVIGLIISEKVHRAAAALAGAVVLILTGVMSGQKALSYIDFNTISVLVGMLSSDSQGSSNTSLSRRLRLFMVIPGRL